jgi:hypothetical protein
VKIGTAPLTLTPFWELLSFDMCIIVVSILYWGVGWVLRAQNRTCRQGSAPAFTLASLGNHCAARKAAHFQRNKSNKLKR